MSFSADSVIRAVKFGDLDAIFDERGSQYIALRKVQWVKEGVEPDESKAKLEIRKYKVTDDGDIPMKGVSFLTEEGPHELAHVLVKEGFGHTKQIIKDIVVRDDFKDSIEHINDDEDIISEDNVFDMRSVMNKISLEDFEKDE